jgi:hypothetical protein
MRLDTALAWVFIVNGILVARVLWHLAPCLKGEFHEELLRTKTSLATTLLVLEQERAKHERAHTDGHCDGCNCFSFLDGEEEASTEASS